MTGFYVKDDKNDIAKSRCDALLQNKVILGIDIYQLQASSGSVIWWYTQVAWAHDHIITVCYFLRPLWILFPVL